MEVGDPRKVRYPASVGLPISPYNLSLFLGRVHKKWGTSPSHIARSAEAGNPLSWGEFSPCECWRWGGVMFVRAIVSEFFVDICT